MSDGGPLPVLVVDGDSVRRGMLACTMPAGRYALHFAPGLEAGLDLLAALMPPLTILGREGAPADACQRIRSLAAGERTVVALMDEGFGDPIGAAAAAEAAGADIALPFPFDVALLEQRLARYRLDRVQARIAQGAVAAARARRERTGRGRTGGGDEPELTWAAFQSRVERLHRRLDTIDYYELLGVGISASAADIRDAFYDLALAYHPDRFLQLRDEPLRERIYEVYKRISEAFKVLTNPEARTAYDQGLASPERPRRLRYVESARGRTREPPEAAETEAGRRYLRFARTAEREGNIKSARMYLGLALEVEPQNQAVRELLERVTRKL